MVSKLPRGEYWQGICQNIFRVGLDAGGKKGAPATI